MGVKRKGNGSDYKAKQWGHGGTATERGFCTRLHDAKVGGLRHWKVTGAKRTQSEIRILKTSQGGEGHSPR